MIGSTAIDKFASSRAAAALALVWGFAEATLFFIVPDVLLTAVSCRALRPALRATVAAVAGALAGGAAMYAMGRAAPEAARMLLDHIPAISPDLISSVERQIGERGIVAVLLGPLRGTPYKIYAAEWGARGGSLMSFLLISVPARAVRFLLAAFAARAIAHFIKPLTGGRAKAELMILAIIWAAFYIFYFARFGW